MNLEKNTTIKRRLASLALAAALAFGGVQALASHDVDDAPETQEVAGGTWSVVVRTPGKGGSVTIQGGTWS